MSEVIFARGNGIYSLRMRYKGCCLHQTGTDLQAMREELLDAQLNEVFNTPHEAANFRVLLWEAAVFLGGQIRAAR